MIRRAHAALLAALVVLFAAQGASAAVTVPSAYEAVLLALENNQGVLASKLQLEQAAALELTARAALGWRLDAVGGYRYSDDVVERLVPPLGIVTTPLRTHTPHATLSVRRSLFTGPSTRLDLDNAARQRTVAELEVESSLRSTALAAYEAYRRLETALLQHQVALGAVEVARSRVEVVESQVRQGTATELALSEARLALQESESRAASAQRLLDLAAKQLSQLLNLPWELEAKDLPAPVAEDEFQAIASGSERYWPEADPLLHDLETLVASAQESRPEVRKVLEQVAMARNELARVSVDNRPKLSAELNYAWNELTSAKITLGDDGILALQATTLQPYNHDTGGAISASKDATWNVGVQVVWNLWDSGVEALSRRRAESALELAESGAEQARSGVALEVRQRHAELLTARETLLTASERALIAGASYELEREKVKAGIGTDLLAEAAKAQRDAAVASAYAARVDYELAVLRLANSAALPLEAILAYVKSLPGGE